MLVNMPQGICVRVEKDHGARQRQFVGAVVLGAGFESLELKFIQDKALVKLLFAFFNVGIYGPLTYLGQKPLKDFEIIRNQQFTMIFIYSKLYPTFMRIYLQTIKRQILGTFQFFQLLRDGIGALLRELVQ